MTKTEIATGKKWEYTWDYRNRLTNVKEKNASGQILKESNFTYDPFDKLIIRSVDPDGPGPQPASVIKTVYDGVHPYADFNGSNSLTDRYLYGPAVDMLLANLEPDGDLFWYLTDHLGTVRDIANKTGSVVDHIKYASFGHVISESQPSNGDRFKFTARELESALDDYFYRARWYDDDAGRFIAEDPIGFKAGDPNLYRYVHNAPTRYVDPTGLFEDIPKPRDERYYPWSDHVTMDGKEDRRRREELERRREEFERLREHYEKRELRPDVAQLLALCGSDAAGAQACRELLDVLQRCPTLPYRPWPFATGDRCEKWAFDCERKLERWQLKHQAKVPYARAQYYDYYGPWPPWSGHVVVEVKIGDVEFYLDNSWLGGSDHIFFEMSATLVNRYGTCVVRRGPQ
jgi:RHS repeat-associated protein